MRFFSLLSCIAPLITSLFVKAAWASQTSLDGNSLHSTVVQRGFIYSYFYKSPSINQPTILFLAGFPSTYHDWTSQISYFADKGYGIIAPDLLGYGGTSAPEDVEDYKLLNIAGDVVDILNHEKVDKVIGVGHDWYASILEPKSVLFLTTNAGVLSCLPGLPMPTLTDSQPQHSCRLDICRLDLTSTLMSISSNCTKKLDTMSLAT